MIPTPRYVTPSLSVLELPGQPTDVDFAVMMIRRHAGAHGPYIVHTWTAAYRVLRKLDLSADEARHRINFARTGDMYATRTPARRRRTALDRA